MVSNIHSILVEYLSDMATISCLVLLQVQIVLVASKLVWTHPNWTKKTFYYGISHFEPCPKSLVLSKTVWTCSKQLRNVQNGFEPIHSATSY